MWLQSLQTNKMATTMTRDFRVRKKNKMAANMAHDFRKGGHNDTWLQTTQKNKMAATMTPDIREGAATMTRGFRVHKKKQDGGPNDT